MPIAITKDGHTIATA